MHTLLTGLTFGESPRWHEGQLWVADWGQRQILSVDADGGSTVVASPPTAPCCIDWTADGRLLVVSGGEAKLLVQEADGSLATFADLAGVTTKPWNEVVVDPAGNAYVNSINFDFPGGEFQPGLIVLVRPDGTVEPVADGLAFPNGMVVTDGGRTLVVAESYAARLTAYTIAADGRLTDRRVWADLGEGAAPDGICVDPTADGVIWYGDVPNRCAVRVAEGGATQRRVDCDLGCFACATDGTTLYAVLGDYTDPEMFTKRTGKVMALPA
jgi:sugar lactone lactonase YvrE